MGDESYRKLYEKIARGTEERKRVLARRELERQRIALKKYNVELSSIQLRMADEIRCVVEQIDVEISECSARRTQTSSMEKRAELKAVIVHLQQMRDRIVHGKKRKPPESGMPVPAVPPKGPLPKQGGAEAPLEFD